MPLYQSLKLTPGDVCSLVGGGGKTSCLFCLAKEDPWGKTLLTTTTMMWDPRKGAHPFKSVQIGPLSELPEAQATESPCFIACDTTENGKVRGFSTQEITRWIKTAPWKLTVIEADGASCRPFKMPDRHEPQIAGATTVTIAVIGLDILGQAASDKNIHRFHLLQEKTGVREGETITLDHLAAVTDHPEGLFKRSPVNARKVLILNKADRLKEETLMRAEDLLTELMQRTRLPDQILITTLSDYSNPSILCQKSRRSSHDSL